MDGLLGYPPMTINFIEGLEFKASRPNECPIMIERLCDLLAMVTNSNLHHQYDSSLLQQFER